MGMMDWKEQLREIARQGLVRKLESEKVEVVRGIIEGKPLCEAPDRTGVDSTGQNAGEAGELCASGTC